MGGPNKPDGSEFQAANGYWYVKVDGDWRLKHHIVAEQVVGHPIDTKVHRVTFKDRDRNNLDPNNLIVAEKKNGKAKRIEAVKAKIRLLEEELEDLESR